MISKSILSDNLKQLLEEYFIVSKETVSKLQEVEELSKNFDPEKNKENLGKLKKAAFLYNLYNIGMIKNIAKIKNSYTLCKLGNVELDFTIGGVPQGVPTNVEEVVQKIIESDPEMVGIVNGNLVILDDSLEDAISNRMEQIQPEELAQLMSKQNEKTE